VGNELQVLCHSHSIKPQMLKVDKSNLSRSLVNLESKGYLTIRRTEGSLAESIILHKVVIKE